MDVRGQWESIAVMLSIALSELQFKSEYDYFPPRKHICFGNGGHIVSVLICCRVPWYRAKIWPEVALPHTILTGVATYIHCIEFAWLLFQLYVDVINSSGIKCVEWGWSAHICLSELCHHWLRWYFCAEQAINITLINGVFHRLDPFKQTSVKFD